MIEPAYAAVAPVFSVEGELARDLARDCVRLEVCEGVEGLRTMQAWFMATGREASGPPGPLLHLDGRTIDLGRAIKVSLGPDGIQRHVFDGVISAVELSFRGTQAVLVVLAEDQLMRLRMTRRMRSYTNTTDAGIARTLADAHGLDADAAARGPTYDVVQQLNQSDLAFLRERARLVQAELWCDGRTLYFRTRDKREGTAITLVQGNHLLSVRLRADLAAQRGTVVVTGYDATRQRTIDRRAGPEAIEAEATGGRNGPRLVTTALGGSTSLRVREVALTTDEADAWARAEMLRRARRFVTVEGTTRGSPDMVVGSRVRLELVGAPFEGPGYYVTHVEHTFDAVNGLRTRFEAERPTLNEVA